MSLSANLNPLERLVRLLGQMMIVGVAATGFGIGMFFVQQIPGPLAAAFVTLGLVLLLVGGHGRRRGKAKLAEISQRSAPTSCGGGVVDCWARTGLTMAARRRI